MTSSSPSGITRVSDALPTGEIRDRIALPSRGNRPLFECEAYSSTAKEHTERPHSAPPDDTATVIRQSKSGEVSMCGIDERLQLAPRTATQKRLAAEIVAALTR